MNEVNHVTLMDPSPEKIDLCRKAVSGISNKNYLIYQSDIIGLKFEPFDIIVSSMAFHHIKDIDSTIKSLASNLKEGGMCFVCDLYPEDGSFHKPDVFVAHHGFKVEEFSQAFVRNGFSKVSYLDFGHYYENDKEYPLFVVISEK
ncbi:methyltransferase, putative [Trichomonas vaginalis G3]|uniref:Methyltransferase, putative n=1 Tax=Trichomonas vaginalis (strain ATCC PRA-98 / G3) TaxID=412133 RepID=A2FXA0_TRIV3|nr:hexaprenyldihydroxybenzoate methyltransferase protein [Trichomonas vaginalis G3]EAX90471.1 methyltransferase, putative [Trichomonas vaginalis G3]KAI5496320.1 hexaprenyldihydroxybenzoate methyltransferase protein [Trichomonas vaginalis G3]|eukprot:XP_001303401.1 methyltransferase [Trichomonas vaginalis G3]